METRTSDAFLTFWTSSASVTYRARCKGWAARRHISTVGRACTRCGRAARRDAPRTTHHLRLPVVVVEAGAQGGGHKRHVERPASLAKGVQGVRGRRGAHTAHSELIHQPLLQRPVAQPARGLLDPVSGQRGGSGAIDCAWSVPGGCLGCRRWSWRSSRGGRRGRGAQGRDRPARRAVLRVVLVLVLVVVLCLLSHGWPCRRRCGPRAPAGAQARDGRRAPAAADLARPPLLKVLCRF